MADFLQQMDRGMALWHERRGDAPAAPAEAGAAAKAPKAKKAAAVGRPKKAVAPAAALPEAEDGAPDASAYRLSPEDIDETTCLARSLDGGEDKRWSPTVYREKQCGKDVVEGSDLCATCTARLARFAEDPNKGMRSKWFARVTEEPPSYTHMLDTQWAADKPPKWRGAADASDAASDSGSEKQMSVASAPKKADKAAAAAEKAAVAAAKKEAKEAAAAEKKAAKEAEAAAKKAAKEAEAAAKKEAKKAEKAAAEKPKKAAAEKPKKAAAEKPKKAAAAAAAASVPAKADTAAAAASVDGEMELIDGTMYWIRNGNVYEYDSMTETAGDFVGRLGADGESIDTDAEEVTGAESDSE